MKELGRQLAHDALGLAANVAAKLGVGVQHAVVDGLAFVVADQFVERDALGHVQVERMKDL